MADATDFNHQTERMALLSLWRGRYAMALPPSPFSRPGEGSHWSCYSRLEPEGGVDHYATCPLAQLDS